MAEVCPHSTGCPFLGLMKSHYLALFVEDRNPIPNIYAYITQCTLHFFLWWFQSFLISGSRFIQSWALCRVENKDLVFICVDVEFSANFCWKCCVFSMSFLFILLSEIRCVVFYLGPLLHSTDQHVCSSSAIRVMFPTLRICNITWNHRSSTAYSFWPGLLWRFWVFCPLFVFILLTYFEELSSCLARVAVLCRVGARSFSPDSSCPIHNHVTRYFHLPGSSSSVLNFFKEIFQRLFRGLWQLVCLDSWRCHFETSLNGIVSPTSSSVEISLV